MQKNDKFYTFLLSHRSKHKIYIRRFEVSRSILHFGTVGIFLFTGFVALGFGVSSVVRHPAFSNILTSTGLQTRVQAAPLQLSENIEFQRPAESSEIAPNSGGPADNDGDGEDSEITNEVLAIKNSSDP